jgi:hypothetical protein
LRSIKVDEGKCEDEIKVSFFSNIAYFTKKPSGATFATYAIVLGVRIMP